MARVETSSSVLQSSSEHFSWTREVTSGACRMSRFCVSKTRICSFASFDLPLDRFTTVNVRASSPWLKLVFACRRASLESKYHRPARTVVSRLRMNLPTIINDS
jgi:hypothetical protein